ncbi:hypothetical protein VSH64_07785 [Amycolatopsis rhabdoformis]|uniref:Uncharacterized protein n=1 Tax=Amycolatopsis rhabdoformis TaxID=1448059 RepID=A0ABZ1ICZ4_9PSEU|nr:hypothetical protein [Amycolatopsis rhabdoformis]WSE32008.1 hypothetical protein VSH64_07785 [Amycolatopsis rhabdoformis]
MVTVRRVFAAGPFTEIGCPATVSDSEPHGLLAVGGRQGTPDWASRTRLSPHVVGVYDRRDLTCRAILRCREPVHALDFHPHLQLLAVGTGEYDGGFSFRGELLLWHYESGRVVSALADRREIRSVRWRRRREGRVLDLAVAPESDEELGRDSHTVGYDAMLTREDWLAVRDGEFAWRDLDGPCRESEDLRDETAARSFLERLSPEWTERGAVGSVEYLADGTVLASAEFAGAQSWSPSGAAAPARAPVAPTPDLPFPVTPPGVPEDLATAGPAVELTDALGPAVVSVASHFSAGFRGSSPEPLRDALLTARLITRRRPDGEVTWTFVAGHQVLALTADAADSPCTSAWATAC